MSTLEFEFSPLSQPYWDALAGGALKFERCPHCSHAWLPARQDCPRCLRPGAVWEAASGRGKLISWVVYHIAYHKSFADRLPYNVAIVELEEGPRLITNIVESEGLAIEHPVMLRIVEDQGKALARFSLA